MSTITILVVEDEGIIARDISTMLEALGYSVCGIASEGLKAVEMATEYKPDLILMDVQLGQGMDGIETARKIHSIMPAPIIYLTAYADEQTLQKSIDTEPFGYIVKPFNERELHTTLEMALFRHRLERELTENRWLLETTLRSIDDGVLTADENDLITFLNQKAEELCQWSLLEARGKSLGEVLRLYNDDMPVAPAELEPGRSRELKLKKGEQQIFVECHRAPMVDIQHGDLGSVFVLRDISKKKQLEEELRHSHKMEAIGRLAGGVAHDFNNLITAIAGYSDLIMSSINESHELYDELSQIKKATEKATSLTHQLLAISRRQVLETTVVNLNDIVGELEKLLRRIIGENITLKTNLERQLHPVLADPGQIQQVILNLAINARDAMLDGGTLTISSENRHLAIGETEQLPPGDYAVITVTDTGSGMEHTTLEHIFEPFFTTKQTGEGTGLGLSTVYGIIHQSQGRIHVDSEPGKGSTFSVFLPKTDPAGREDGPQDKNQSLHTGNETVLLVEDEDMVRSLAKTILNKQGFTVLAATNAAQAKKILETLGAGPDLLITDIVLPDQSGTSLLEDIVKQQPGIRTLFMSGYSEQRLPADVPRPFLHKPFTLQALLEAVRNALDS